MTWTIRKLIILTVISNSERGEGFDSLHYHTDTEAIYQVFNFSDSTKDGAKAVCQMCSTGSLVMPKTDAIQTSISINLIQAAGITTGQYWIGLKKGWTTWSWDDSTSLTDTNWDSDQPGSGHAAIADVDSLNKWSSRSSSDEIGNPSYIACQYDNSVVGKMETDWESWGPCDYKQNTRSRRLLCKSPASPIGSGCRCEDYLVYTGACEQITGENQVVNNGLIYQKYSVGVDWYQANDICSMCEAGSVVMLRTDPEKSFVVGHFFPTNMWNRSYFLGLSRDGENAADWMWLDSTQVTYENWGLAQPWNRPHFQVATVYELFLQTWVANDPSTHVTDVICQYPEAIAGTFGEWSSWGGCDESTGQRKRYKRCNSPATPGCTCQDTQEDMGPCETPFLRAYYISTSSTGYHLYDARVNGYEAQQMCQNCSGLSGSLVQYQTTAKYMDVYTNFLQYYGVENGEHWIGLTDERSEGVWSWLSGEFVGFNWTWWDDGQPDGWVLENGAILRALQTPIVRDANIYGNSSNDMADFVVCEYEDVVIGGIWGEWSPWNPCVSGMMSRTRHCAVPAPDITGCSCSGVTIESNSCQVPVSSTEILSTVTFVQTSEVLSETLTSLFPSSSVEVSLLPSILTTDLSVTANVYPSSAMTVSLDPSPSYTSVPTYTFQSSSLSADLSLSSVEPSFSMTTFSLTPSVCACTECSTTHSSLTSDELQEKVQSIVHELTIDKQTTSASRRKLTSANDNRIVARGVGLGLAVGVLTIFVAVIIMFDVDVFRRQAQILFYRMNSSRRT